MKKRLREKHGIAVIIIALLILIIVSASIVTAIAQKTFSKPLSMEDSAPSTYDSKDEKKLYNLMYSTTHNRSRWLYDLLSASGKAALADGSNPLLIFEAAKKKGVIGSYTEKDLYEPLTRLFVAQTTVKALGYKQRSTERLTDITSQQSEMSTMAYYGYFLPDINGMVHPDAEITAAEYENLQTELERFRLLKGKTVLSFGDSIMHGSGNNDEGISDMIAEKYGMTAADYAVPGAAMGYRDGRGHIRDQLSAAVYDQVKPDIILLNGGTNDMGKTALGSFTEGTDLSLADESTFTGGFEKTLWSIRQNWKNIPVIYIRVHNMDLCKDTIERQYGERALAIAKKWSIVSVDLYENTDLNTEDPAICTRYTAKAEAGSSIYDSIHPTAIGYAKFYLPLVSEAVVSQFNKE